MKASPRHSHYIAAIESYPYARQTDGYAARDELDTCCHLLADYFAAENPCFDMRLFLGACGIEGY